MNILSQEYSKEYPKRHWKIGSGIMQLEKYSSVRRLGKKIFPGESGIIRLTL